MTPRILVVDDDEAGSQMIKLVLASENYDIRVVNESLAALEVAQSWEPNLILLDVAMPQLNGFELCSRLRQYNVTASIPIIMLTARDTLNDKIMGFEAGADDYIGKPYNNTELQLRVAARLRRVQGSPREERPYSPVRTISVPLVVSSTRSGMFRRGYRITKRIFDIAACLITAPFTILLMLAIALAVRFDSPGPIVFVQERTGLNGKRFRMYKFRTMVKNAEELKEKYAHLNELTPPDFKITDDPRMTRIGKFLRRTSLDEIPQLWNVLIGQMSIVGPRPTSFHPKTYQLWQTERLEVLPGLTGLWQIKGRSDIDFEERVELDIEYIERQSWALDLAILFQTFRAVIGGRGAH